MVGPQENNKTAFSYVQGGTRVWYCNSDITKHCGSRSSFAAPNKRIDAQALLAKSDRRQLSCEFSMQCVEQAGRSSATHLLPAFERQLEKVRRVDRTPETTQKHDSKHDQTRHPPPGTRTPSSIHELFKEWRKIKPTFRIKTRHQHNNSVISLS